MDRLTKLSQYSYALPKGLIAQHPCSLRDASRLMVVDRKREQITTMCFRELKQFLQPGDSLVLNNTKVIPARLFGQRETGGNAEIFLVKKVSGEMWEVLSKPARKLKVGVVIHFGENFSCEVIQELEAGVKIVKFNAQGDFDAMLNTYGHIPLPHYIERGEVEPTDIKRYQTVYATRSGAVAAPTAGLHFTEELIQALSQNGVSQHYITLHVGLGTFRPVNVEDIREHQMHTEFFEITKEVANALNARPKNRRQICVGTTCCRALEASSGSEGVILPCAKETDIFIYPGYQFKFVDTLLTNFHLPRSSLLMLVCAFGGYEMIMEAYRKAVLEEYRFYSYGDAMLII